MQGPHFGRPDRGLAGDAVFVTAHGSVAIPAEEMPALRKAPGPADGRTVPGSLLRHADDHTVLAMAAALRALAHRETAADAPAPSDDWGVLVAPRYPGRLAVSNHFERFLQQGPSSVSPLIIPTMSLHAAAGSVSLGLGLHGPSYGVGGGPGNLAQALLAGIGALGNDPRLPGLWIIATGWDPEPIPDAKGKALHPATARAVALGLERQPVGKALPLSVVAGGADAEDPPRAADPGRLAELMAWLESDRSAEWSLPVEGGLIIRLTASHVQSAQTAGASPGVSRCNG